MADRPSVLRNKTFIAFRSIFTAEECDRIMAFSMSSNNFQEGVVWHGGTGAYIVDNELRKVRTSYHPRNEATAWIYQRMDECFHEAAAHFALDIKNESEEEIKIMMYGPTDHFTKWHRDTGPDYSGLRKLSMSVLLSERDAYEGGHLEIDPEEPTRQTLRINLPKGAGVAFPSDKLHRVAPIVSGTRFSLVNWIN